MKNKKSFTLVELLISLAIFAVIMVALYAAFDSGMFGLRQIEESAVTSESGYLVLSRIEKDLRNAFAYSAEDAKFIGKKDALSFFTLSPEFTSVSYSLRENNLLRLTKINQEALKTDPALKPKILAKNVKQIEFTYFYIDPDTQALKEAGDWKDATAFPAAVRVVLTLEKKKDAPFTRTIYLL